MTNQIPTIAELASEAYGYFERFQRSEDEVLWKTKDGTPDWVQDLVHEAHGQFLPDDWRYEAIHSALSDISDSGAEDVSDLDDAGHEFADGNVDSYNGARAQWLASNLARAGYCDEAASEFDFDPDSGIFQLIALGQYRESEEVWVSVVHSLQERREELESELEDASEADDRGVVEVFDADAYKSNHPSADIVTCGVCDRSWDDAVATAWTPAPSARCPFEHEHEDAS